MFRAGAVWEPPVWGAAVLLRCGPRSLPAARLAPQLIVQVGKLKPLVFLALDQVRRTGAPRAL